jgi:hypothetical protein
MDVFSDSQEEYFNRLEMEVLNYFPEYKQLISMRYLGSGEGMPLNSSQALLLGENLLYQNTEYSYKEIDNSFLHFTDYDSLLSILKTQTVRFKTLNGMNDLNEIIYAAKLFKNYNLNFESMRKEIFSFSLVRYLSSNEEIKKNSNNLDLWRFYGRNGEGVSIKLKIVNDPLFWDSFHLCPIFYGESHLANLKNLQSKIVEFNSNNPAFYLHLPKIFSYHKSSHFKNEDEVRLIYTTHFDSMLNKHSFPISISDISKKELPLPLNKLDDSDVYYATIPLAKKNCSELENRYFEFAPKIVIEEIILGYKFKDTELSKYQNSIRAILNESNGLDILPENIYITELKDLFRP